MAFDVCVLTNECASHLSSLKSRDFVMNEVRCFLLSDKLTALQIREKTAQAFLATLPSDSVTELSCLYSVSQEVNISITGEDIDQSPQGYTVLVLASLVVNETSTDVCLCGCVSDELIIADSRLKFTVNIEETKNVFSVHADFDGAVVQGLLHDNYYTKDEVDDLVENSGGGSSGDFVDLVNTQKVGGTKIFTTSLTSTVSGEDTSQDKTSTWFTPNGIMVSSCTAYDMLLKDEDDLSDLTGADASSATLTRSKASLFYFSFDTSNANENVMYAKATLYDKVADDGTTASPGMELYYGTRVGYDKKALVLSTDLETVKHPFWKEDTSVSNRNSTTPRIMLEDNISSDASGSSVSSSSSAIEIEAENVNFSPTGTIRLSRDTDVMVNEGAYLTLNQVNYSQRSLVKSGSDWLLFLPSYASITLTEAMLNTKPFDVALGYEKASLDSGEMTLGDALNAPNSIVSFCLYEVHDRAINGDVTQRLTHITSSIVDAAYQEWLGVMVTVNIGASTHSYFLGKDTAPSLVDAVFPIGCEIEYSDNASTSCEKVSWEYQSGGNGTDVIYQTITQFVTLHVLSGTSYVSLQTYVNSKVSSGSSSGNYVTLDTDQTISSRKTFEAAGQTTSTAILYNGVLIARPDSYNDGDYVMSQWTCDGMFLGTPSVSIRNELSRTGSRSNLLSLVVSDKNNSNIGAECTYLDIVKEGISVYHRSPDALDDACVFQLEETYGKFHRNMNLYLPRDTQIQIGVSTFETVGGFYLDSYSSDGEVVYTLFSNTKRYQLSSEHLSVREFDPETQEESTDLTEEALRDVLMQASSPRVFLFLDNTGSIISGNALTQSVMSHMGIAFVFLSETNTWEDYSSARMFVIRDYSLLSHFIPVGAVFTLSSANGDVRVIQRYPSDGSGTTGTTGVDTITNLYDYSVQIENADNYMSLYSYVQSYASSGGSGSSSSSVDFTSISSSLISTSNSSYDLGAPLLKWGTAYITSLDVDGLTFSKYGDGLDCSCHLTPYSTNTYNLGSESYRWSNVYANTLNANTLNGVNASLYSDGIGGIYFFCFTFSSSNGNIPRGTRVSDFSSLGFVVDSVSEMIDDTGGSVQATLNGDYITLMSCNTSSSRHFIPCLRIS